MTPVEATDPNDAVEQDPFDYAFELETTAVNHGSVPEGLAFWRRWRKPPQPPQATLPTTEEADAQAHLVELDSRRRVALGHLGNPAHDRYLVTEHTDGTLVFVPAVVMTAHEAALLRHPELVEQIRADQADPARAVRSKARRTRRGRAG